jgi:hypothetical protein
MARRSYLQPHLAHCGAWATLPGSEGAQRTYLVADPVAARPGSHRHRVGRPRQLPPVLHWPDRQAREQAEPRRHGQSPEHHLLSPPPGLSPALQEEPRAALAAAARREPWAGTDVATWMSQRLGRPITYRLGWSYRVRLRRRLQVPRPQHARADPEQQATFKNRRSNSHVHALRLY